MYRALGHLPALRFAALVADDGAIESLAEQLRSFGWADSSNKGGPPDSTGTIQLVLGDDGHVATLLTFVGTSQPDVVAVRQRDTSTVRAWPGWDEGVVALGYAPCQFTGSWRLYVADSRAEELGPLLSLPGGADAQVSSGTDSEEGLVEEVVRWRTAALVRWAEGTTMQRASVNTAAEQEAAQLRAVLAATHNTVSWRITRPLRLIQSRRLRGARG